MTGGSARRMVLPLLALFAPQLASAAELPKGKNGIFPVSSQYSDSSNGKKVRLTGTGSLIVEMGEPKDRWFVLTSAHVSQGEETQIRIGDKPVQILGRLADNRNDVELIEIENPGEKALFVYFAPDDSYIMSSDQVEAWSSRKWPWSEPEVDPKKTLAMGLSSLVQGFTLLPPWMSKPDRGIEATDGESVRRAGGLTPDVHSVRIGDELYADASLFPGLSGSPLIAADFVKGLSTFGFKLKGISKRYLNHFKGSYFTSATAVMRLRQQFIAGERGQVDSTRWHYGHGTTFRDFGDGTREIRSEARPAGSALSQDSGGGGNGTSSDGGGGTSSDGGDGAPSATMDLPYGMLWKGHPVIGFRVQDQDGTMRPILAEVAALSLIEHSKRSDRRVEPVLAGSDLTSLAQSRFRRSHLPFSVVSYGILDFKKQNIRDVYVAVDRTGLRVVMRITTDRSKSGEGEVVAFTLDPQGRHVEAKGSEFKPVILVQTSQGERFRIDVSSLLFENPSEISTHAGGPRIRVRNERNGAESEISGFQGYPGSLEGVFKAVHPALSPCFAHPEFFPEIMGVLESARPALSEAANSK